MEYDKIMNQYEDLIHKTKLKMQYYMKPNIFSISHNNNSSHLPIHNSGNTRYQSSLNKNENYGTPSPKERKLSPQNVLNLKIKPDQNNNKKIQSKNSMQFKNGLSKLPIISTPTRQITVIKESRLKQQYGSQLKKQILQKHQSKKAIKIKELIQNKYYMSNNNDYFRFGQQSKLLSKRTLQKLHNQEVINKFRKLEEDKSNSNQKSRILKKFYEQSKFIPSLHSQQIIRKQKSKNSMDHDKIFIPLEIIDQQEGMNTPLTKYRPSVSKNISRNNRAITMNNYSQTQQKQIETTLENPEDSIIKQKKKQQSSRKINSRKKKQFHNRTYTLSIQQYDEENKMKQIQRILKNVQQEIKQNTNFINSRNQKKYTEQLKNLEDQVLQIKNSDTQREVNSALTHRNIVQSINSIKKSSIDKANLNSQQIKDQNKQSDKSAISPRIPAMKLFKIKNSKAPIMTKQRKNYLIQSGQMEQYLKQLEMSNDRLQQLDCMKQ